VLIATVGFFLAVAAVDSVLIYKAVSTFGGETDDAYRIGLGYNKRIAEEEEQDRLGWTEASSYDATKGVVNVTLKDSTGAGIDGLTLAGTLGRPATNTSDHQLAFSGQGGGTYVAPAPGLGEGTWAMTLTASRGEGKNSNVVYRWKSRLWKQP